MNLPDLRTFDLLAPMQTLAVQIAKSSKYNSPLSLHVDSMFYLVVGVLRRSNVHVIAHPSARPATTPSLLLHSPTTNVDIISMYTLVTQGNKAGKVVWSPKIGLRAPSESRQEVSVRAERPV